MKDPNGELKLTFRTKQSGKTYVARQQYKLPLQVTAPFYQDEDGTAFLYPLNLAGGIFGRDYLLTEVDLEAGSRALITTTSAAKLYKMNDGDYAVMENHFRLGENSVLEYLPDCNIPFAQSDTIQKTVFRLKESSFLLAVDFVTPGRIDRGEFFSFKRYCSDFKIYVEEELVAYEKINLRPDEYETSGIGLMENYSNYASIYIYNRGIPEDYLKSLRKAVCDWEGIYGGCSLLKDSLVVVKILGNSVDDMNALIDEIWDVTRRKFLGKCKVKLRKL